MTHDEWLALAEHLADEYKAAEHSYRSNAFEYIDAARDKLFAHLRAAPGREPADLAKPCDGKEQDAFEAWAKNAKYNMELHPLHWLFLNPETYAARQGWKAALEYAYDRVAAPAEEAQPAEPVWWEDVNSPGDLYWQRPDPAQIETRPLFAAPPAVRAQALEEILSRAPHFPGVSGAEPPLVDLIRRFYRMHFADRKIADGYAEQYIAALKDQP